MIHYLQTVNDLPPLYAELKAKNIGFYAFIGNAEMGDENQLGPIVSSVPYPEYHYDMGDMIFETEEAMRGEGIDKVYKLILGNGDTVYVGYNIHGLPIFYDMDLKRI